LKDKAARKLGMKKREAKTFAWTDKLFNSFSKLRELHASDTSAVTNAIHVIQNILMSRPFYRKYKKT